jgi:hypothetical protein
MPNGADKNFIRLCAAIDGFRICYKAWPKAIRLPEGAIADLRDHVLGPQAFAKVEAKVRLIPDNAFMVAEDGTGRTYEYGEMAFPDQEPDVCTRDWLGVEPLEGVNIDHAMEAALHLAAQPNYLGDPAVIDGVLTGLWKTVFQRWNVNVADAAAAVKADSEACEAAARIFLGLDAKFTAMPAWNRPGIIDCHVAKVTRYAELPHSPVRLRRADVPRTGRKGRPGRARPLCGASALSGARARPLTLSGLTLHWDFETGPRAFGTAKYIGCCLHAA